MVRLALTLCASLWLAGPLAAQDRPPIDSFLATVALAPVAEVEALLKRYPELSTQTDDSGFQAIHMLDYVDFDAKLALLLAKGADINAQNDEGIALIHILIDPEFLPAVLAAGANIDLPSYAGETPLMVFAIEPQGADMIDALLDAGANADLRDKQGLSVLGRLRRDGVQLEAIERLIAAGAAP